MATQEKPNKSKPSVAVVGASADRSKMSNKAVRAYQSKGYDVFPVHPRAEKIEGLEVYRSLDDLPQRPQVVSLYVPPAVGLQILPQVSQIRPKEFFVNPGAESAELMDRAYAAGLEPILACSITALGISPESL